MRRGLRKKCTNKCDKRLFVQQEFDRFDHRKYICGNFKKIKPLLFAILFIPALTFAQGKITTVEIQALHPELFNQPLWDYSSIQEEVVTGDTGKELLKGFAYTYVGYFDGLTGPNFWDNPPCYTGQEAAALIFGGVPDDYAISTNTNITDPNTITFTAWMVTWGIAGWAEHRQNHKHDIGNVGYYDPGGCGTATSAYIWDNPPPPGSSINYVWRVEAIQNVPVSNWALFTGLSLILLFAVIRLKRIL